MTYISPKIKGIASKSGNNINLATDSIQNK